MSDKPRSVALTRADLAGLECAALRRGHPHKADLSLYEVAGRQVLLKDYREKTGFWRWVVGRLGTALEARALQALDGLDGVPRFCGRPDRDSVVMTYLPGQKVNRSLRGDERFVRELEAVVRGMHERGVVHLDLKHRSNVMVSSDRHPIIIDFESALVFDTRRPLSRIAFRRLRRADMLSMQNWKRRLCPELLAGSKRDLRRAHLASSARGMIVPRRIVDALLDILLRRAGGGPVKDERLRRRRERAVRDALERGKGRKPR